MMISTRGRYCLRVMIDLAEHQGEGYIRMKEVAQRQGISLKYRKRSCRLWRRATLSMVFRARAAVTA